MVLILFDDNSKVDFCNSCKHYMLKVNNQNNSRRCKIYLKIINKALEWRQWYHSVVFLVNFETLPCSSIFIVDFEHVMQVGIIQKFCFLFQTNMCAPWFQRKLKISRTNSVPSAQFCIKNNFAELQLMPMSEVSFNTFELW